MKSYLCGPHIVPWQDIVQSLCAHRTQHFKLDDCCSLVPGVHDRAIDSFGWQKLECAQTHSGAQDSSVALNGLGLDFSRIA